MSQGRTFFVQGPLQMLAVDAGLSGNRQRRLIDFDNLIHLFHIDDNTAVKRNHSPLAAGPAAVWNNRNPVAGGQFMNT